MPGVYGWALYCVDLRLWSSLLQRWGWKKNILSCFIHQENQTCWAKQKSALSTKYFGRGLFVSWPIKSLRWKTDITLLQLPRLWSKADKRPKVKRTVQLSGCLANISAGGSKSDGLWGDEGGDQGRRTRLDRPLSQLKTRWIMQKYLGWRRTKPRLLIFEWRNSWWPPGRPAGLLIIWQQPAPPYPPISILFWSNLLMPFLILSFLSMIRRGSRPQGSYTGSPFPFHFLILHQSRPSVSPPENSE